MIFVLDWIASIVGKGEKWLPDGWTDEQTHDGQQAMT